VLPLLGPAGGAKFPEGEFGHIFGQSAYPLAMNFRFLHKEAVNGNHWIFSNI